MSTSTIIIRRATLADLEIIVAFNAAMALETEKLALDPQVLRAGVAAALENPMIGPYYVAECEGAVVGQLMITFEWSDWRNANIWWVQSVYVAKPFRRRGIFRLLYQHVRNEAQSRPDVCGIRLYAYNENHRALQTYRDLGMKVTKYVVCDDSWASLGGTDLS